MRGRKGAFFKLYFGCTSKEFQILARVKLGKKVNFEEKRPFG